MRTIRNENLTVQINEIGAALYSIQDKNGNEYLWQGDPKYWTDRAPNLFPHIGRLTDGKYTLDGNTYEMKIHGIVRHMPFEVEQISDTQIVFSVADTEETKKQYPYAFHFSITYTLNDNRLSILYGVKNDDDKTMYFGVGGHPGFNVPLEKDLSFEDYYLEFDEVANAKRVQFSETCFVNGKVEDYELEGGVKMPLRHHMFDNDAIVLVDMSRGVSLKSDRGKKAVHVRYPDMDYIGFWHKPKSDAPYVCIEPWSSLPARDGVIEDFSTQPTMLSLEAGKTYQNLMEITVF